MAAPNLKNPTTITGKTVGYAVTTSLAAALSNAAASNKLLKVNSVYCANVDGLNAADITLEHYDGTTGFKIGNTISVPAFVLSSGIMALAGVTGTSTLTKAVSTTDAYMTFALRGPNP